MRREAIYHPWAYEWLRVESGPSRRRTLGSENETNGKPMGLQTHPTTPPLSRTQFNDYIVYHAHRLSPKDLRTLADQLPSLRDGFSEVRTSQFPHTPERLHFLADVLEAFVSGTYETLPFESAAEAAFRLRPDLLTPGDRSPSRFAPGQSGSMSMTLRLWLWFSNATLPHSCCLFQPNQC